MVGWINDDGIVAGADGQVGKLLLDIYGEVVRPRIALSFVRISLAHQKVVDDKAARFSRAAAAIDQNGAFLFKILTDIVPCMGILPKTKTSRRFIGYLRIDLRILVFPFIRNGRILIGNGR